jgi:hypothetical protein
MFGHALSTTSPSIPLTPTKTTRASGKVRAAFKRVTSVYWRMRSISLPRNGTRTTCAATGAAFLASRPPLPMTMTLRCRRIAPGFWPKYSPKNKCVFGGHNRRFAALARGRSRAVLALRRTRRLAPSPVLFAKIHIYFWSST